MDYTTLSLAEVRGVLQEVARDAQATFGGLDVQQLNWRPDPTRWSVAQCFEHLVMSNRMMLEAATDALEHPSATLRQRMPVAPGFFGRMLIRSQSPTAPRRFRTSPKAEPASSTISLDIIPRFVAQHDELGTWMAGLDEGEVSRAIMISPFLRIITYSVLDSCRLLAAHDRRHFEQARRVTQAPGFPGS